MQRDGHTVHKKKITGSAVFLRPKNKRQRRLPIIITITQQSVFFLMLPNKDIQAAATSLRGRYRLESNNVGRFLNEIIL